MRKKDLRSTGGNLKSTFRFAGIGALALLCGISISGCKARSEVAGAAPAGAAPSAGAASSGKAPAASAAQHATRTWPANVHLVEAKLAPKEFENPGLGNLPQLRIYDRQGRLLYERDMYQSGWVGETLPQALAARPIPGKGENPLAAELQRFQSLEGQPLPPLPATDLRIVEWWADWCIPCHVQATELAEALAKIPQTKVALVYVDAARPGLEVGGGGESPYTPEMTRKLKDPHVSADEKLKILEAAYATEKPKESVSPSR